MLTDRKLPFVKKSFKRLTTLGKISYLASFVTTVVGGAAALWQVFTWADDQISFAEKTAIWQAESVLMTESHLIEDDPDKSDRYKELEKRIAELQEQLKD